MSIYSISIYGLLKGLYYVYKFIYAYITELANCCLVTFYLII